jgi:hypothetical protein
MPRKYADFQIKSDHWNSETFSGSMGKKKFVSQTDLKIAVIGDEVCSFNNLFSGNHRTLWLDSVWRA